MKVLALRHPFQPPSQLGRRRRLRLTGGLVLLLAGGVATTFFAPPIVLMNTTPSEPPGLYFRTGEPLIVGRIIAFRLPAKGMDYVQQTMPYLRHRSLLKAVAAGPGDQVCTRSGELVVNGVRLAPIATQDRYGGSLPHWVDCRRMGPGEWFVFSARVPNSFDSRYYGPVSRTAVLGVYRHLPTAIGRGA